MAVSDFKSMETLRCHSNQSSHLIGRKQFMSRTMLISCMQIVRFIPLMAFEKLIFKYFTKLYARCMSPWEPIRFGNKSPETLKITQ